MDAVGHPHPTAGPWRRQPPGLFLDPPKDTATDAIRALQGHGVAVKVLTGDDEPVARKICGKVGLATSDVLLGEDIAAGSRDDLCQFWQDAKAQERQAIQRFRQLIIQEVQNDCF